MSRPLRIHYPHAWYHVMNRGAGRQKIFRSRVNREMFLELLKKSHKCSMYISAKIRKSYNRLLKQSALFNDVDAICDLINKEIENS